MATTANETAGGTPAGKKKEVFRSLVEAQDGGMAVPESRRRVAEQFDLTDDELRAIELEGVDKNWPPL